MCPGGQTALSPSEMLQKSLWIKSEKKVEAGKPGAKGQSDLGSQLLAWITGATGFVTRVPGERGVSVESGLEAGAWRGPWGWGPGLTSMRKSPIRSPARHATPPSSTDSRYCSAGKAGVGVNSSMGVCAADGRSRRGRRGEGGEAEQGMGLRPKSQRLHRS